MTTTPLALVHVLAQEDGNWGRLIFGLVFFAIWAVSALVSWLGKRQQEERRRRLREQVERVQERVQERVPVRVQERREPREPQRSRPGEQRAPVLRSDESPRRQHEMPSRPTAAPTPPMPPMPVRVQDRPRPKPVRRPTAAKRATVPPPPPPRILEPRRRELERPPALSIAAGPGQSRTRADASSARATAIARWLNPQTLRQQYILTEILQPPISLRPPRQDL